MGVGVRSSRRAEGRRGHTGSSHQRRRGGRRSGESRWEQRKLSDPRQRAHRQAQLAERDAQKRAHDVGVELGSGAPRKFFSSFGGSARLLVRANRCHHVKRVGDCDDARCERDVGAAQTVRIAIAIPPFVVFTNGTNGFTQPAGQRRRQLCTNARMALDCLVFVRCERVWFVEDLERDFELADVVQECSPSQIVDLCFRKSELLTNHLRIGTDPLGVSTRQPVMPAEIGNELQQTLCGESGLVRADPSILLQPPLQHDGASGSHGDLEARWRLVREHQCQAHECGKGQHPPGHSIGAVQNDGRGRGDGNQPHRRDWPTVGHRDQCRECQRSKDRAQKWHGVDDEANRTGQPWTPEPAIPRQVLASPHI